MSVALHHVFVFASIGAPEAERLLALGFAEGSGGVHRGQGTANRRFFFEASMLELIWAHDAREAQSEAIAPTGIWERSRFRETGASPFGICVIASGPLPFETWSYRPPYLGPDRELLVGRARSVAEPIVFGLPGGAPPRERPAHSNGARAVTGVHVTLSEGTEASPPLVALDELGLATFAIGREPLMDLTLDGGAQSRSADLRPDLPLALRW